MVNLLFISNNPKIDTVKKYLQPLLKAKVDIVGDFDFGLKEVFEKRPAMIFIQDQIAGVTGESVARHIQMLLGSGAPVFVFMHGGNIKAKPVKDLYDHLIDLSQDDQKVLADIQSVLKRLLGNQWQKVFVLPRSSVSDVKSALTAPDEHRITADKLVDGFISDLGDVSHGSDNTCLLPDFSLPVSSAEEPFRVMSSTQDQLDEILTVSASNIKQTASDADLLTVQVIDKTYSAPAAFSPQIAKVVACDGIALPEKQISANVDAPETGPTEAISRIYAPDITEKPLPLPITPANFKIARGGSSVESVANELRKDFEENHTPRQTFWGRFKVVVILLLCSIGVFWYVAIQKPPLTTYIAKPSSPVAVSQPVEKQYPATATVTKDLPVDQNAAKPALPAFIPLSGYDSSFVLQKPGWERYVGTDSEFRVFLYDGKLKALQVLAAEGYVISESRLKSLLTELVGTDAYRITALEHKHGFQVSRATVARKADLLIYRNKDGVHAFVVSLD